MLAMAVYQPTEDVEADGLIASMPQAGTRSYKSNLIRIRYFSSVS